MTGEIFKMLNSYKKLKRHSFSMPGHKNGKGFRGDLSKLDVTELADTDSLHNSDGACQRASMSISKAYGADMSIIMVNGSTGGIFTMLASTLKRGDTVLVSRISHMSVMNACITLGLKPIFFEHKFYAEFSLYGEADLEDFSKKLEENPVKAVLVVSPNYNGIVSDIKGMSEILAGKNIPLLVDEAHGAHFIASDDFPKNSIRLGADMSITSTHKTLNALNQSAILNVKSKIVDYDRVKTMSAFFQTSSPSYPIAASCESAVVEVGENSSKWLGTLKMCRELKNVLKEKTLIKPLELSGDVFGLDPTRITLNLSAYDVEGHKISEILRNEYNIDIEMADNENILLIATAANDKKDFEVLKKALLEISGKLKIRDIKKGSIKIPDIKCISDPSAAFYDEGEWVELEKSVGRVSKGTVLVYPPGVPIIVTGSEITTEAVEFLNSCGGEIIGLRDGKIPVKKEGF